MECFNKTVITLSFVSLLSIVQGFSQSMPADSAILALKEGILVVRLPMYEKKLNILKQQREKALKPKTQAKWDKMIQKTEEEKTTMIQEYSDAFKQYYTFSGIAFVYDNEIRDMIVRDTSGQILSTPLLSRDKLFFLFFERTEDSKVNAMVIHGPGKRPIKSPFPDAYTTGGISKLWADLTGKSNADGKVKNMNRKLHLFYANIMHRMKMKQ